MALGGNDDQTGTVKTARIIRAIKDEFKLAFNVAQLMESLDEEEEGAIDFAKFKSIFY